MKKIILFILIQLPLLLNAQINLIKNFATANTFMQFNNQLFFYANDGINVGLWKTDGTTAGTVFVKPLNGIEISVGREHVVSGGLLYFNDTGGVLWRTDGTTSGTFMLNAGYAQAFHRVDLNGVLIFAALDSDGIELWRSDGSLTGTYKITDFYPGPNSGFSSKNMAKQGNYIYFVGNTNNSLVPLCRTDGTASGTQVVPNSGKVQSDLNVINGKIIFSSVFDYNVICVGYPNNDIKQVPKIMKAEDGICTPISSHLTYILGSYPTSYCTYLNSNFGNSNYFRKSGNKLFFRGQIYPNPGISNFSTDQFWVTDGTNINLLKTFPAKNIGSYNEGPGVLEPVYFSMENSIDNSFLGDIFYFPAGDDNSGYEVWRSDGTVAGTFLLKEIRDGSTSSDPTDFRTVNGITYFTAHDGTKRKLFKTDGSTAGTIEVSDPNSVLNLPSSTNQLNTPANQKNLWSNAIGSKFLFVGTPTSGTGITLFSVCTTPIAPVITSNTSSTICAGSSTTLTATGCNGSVSWSNGASTSAITVNPTANTTYTSNCNDVCGISPSSSITINVNPLPTVPTLSQTGTQVVCPNTTVNLSASNCNGSLTWSNGATTSAIIINSIGTYYAFCTNTCGMSTSTFFVLANPSLTENLSGIASNGTTKAIQTINSTQNINNGINSTYTASKSIILNPNFTANNGAVFKAEIGTCAITAGLLAHYNMNNNVNDQSGNGHNATFANTTITTGRKGDANGAYSFNGINQSIHLGTWFNLQEFTISMWLNAASTQNNPYAMIIDNNHGHNISFSTQQDFNTTNQYYFAVGGTPTYGYTGFSLTPNQWEHIVLVKGNGYIIVYKNGVFLGNAYHSGLIDYTSTIPALCLGAYVNNGNNIRYWAGKMDDIKIYNRAVSDVEVSYLYSE